VSDQVVKIYLYVLISLNLLLPLLYGILWLAQSQRPRHPLVKAALLWRDVFFLLAGVIGWYIFSARLVNNWLVMIATLILLMLGAYAAEVIGRKRSKRGANNHAT
jgi:TctA family transporter